MRVLIGIADRSYTTTPASSYQSSSILSQPAAVGEYQQMMLANDPTLLDSMYHLPSMMGPEVGHPPTPPQTYMPPSPSLPAYRPAPDYESVMKRRMENMTPQNLEQMNNLANTNLSQAQVYCHPEMTAYSQPEISQFAAHYINQSHVYSNGLFDIGVNNNYHYRPVDRSNSLNVHPTYSSPDLNGVMMNGDVLRQYRPPPPYPRPSNSTPDLASQTTRSRGNIGDSPDLVSRRNINLGALVEQSRLDQSIENLNMEAYNLHISQQLLQQQTETTPQTFSNHIYANTPPVDTTSYSIQNTPLPVVPPYGNQQQYNHGHQVAVSHTNSAPSKPMGQQNSAYNVKSDLDSSGDSRIPSDHGSSVGKGSISHSKTSSFGSSTSGEQDEVCTLNLYLPYTFALS